MHSIYGHANTEYIQLSLIIVEAAYHGTCLTSTGILVYIQYVIVLWIMIH